MSKPWEILHGDVRKVLKTLPDNSFDAVLSDPPYGLSFMGRRWDYSVPSAMVWADVERVLKPGAHAMIFGGSRTFHRLVVAAEDGGLEVRDIMMWLYGSGFPKSTDISKEIDKKLGAVREQKRVKARNPKSIRGGKGVDGGDRPVLQRARAGDGTTLTAGDDPVTPEAKLWDGYGTALKPAYEPILLARKFLEGTLAEAALEHGIGGLAIDGSRVGDEWFPKSRSTGEVIGRSQSMAAPLTKSEVVGWVQGRWPSNIVLSHHPLCEEGACVELCPVSMLGPDVARYYYTAKADRYQREAGLEALKKQRRGVGALRDGGRQSVEAANIHPTVKPIDLIRYLAGLILPPKRPKPRRILVPYCGVSSEMIGCMQAGWDEVVGIEREAEYIAIAKERITKGGVLSGLMDRSMRRRKK